MGLATEWKATAPLLPYRTFNPIRLAMRLGWICEVSAAVVAQESR
jgi:hypothetical protein